MLTIITNRARVFYLQAHLRQPRFRQLVEAHVLDLGQPRLALLKGAGDVTTHGSPLGKWLLGRGRARRDRSARPDAAGAGALRPSATSEWGPRSLEHRHPGRPWALRSLVSPGLRALQRPESVKYSTDQNVPTEDGDALRVAAADCQHCAVLRGVKYFTVAGALPAYSVHATRRSRPKSCGHGLTPLTTTLLHLCSILRS